MIVGAEEDWNMEEARPCPLCRQAHILLIKEVILEHMRSVPTPRPTIKLSELHRQKMLAKGMRFNNERGWH